MMNSEEFIVLSNEIIKVYFSVSFPLIQKYIHQPSQKTFAGHPEDGVLVIDDVEVNWGEFSIELDAKSSNNQISYLCTHEKDGYILKFNYSLNNYEVIFKLEVDNVQDKIQELNWTKLPFITIKDKNFYFWRENWKQKSWSAKWGKGTYNCYNKTYKLNKAKIDGSAKPTLHCCAFDRKSLCFAIYSNFRVFPLFTQVISNKEHSKFLNMGIYQNKLHARGRKLDSLRVSIAFLSDYNNDNRIDKSDYFLWLNRQLPSPPIHIHDDHMWYKIFLAKPNMLATTLTQAFEIIRAIANITNNYPQIPFLVGWQYKGHDTDYPAINRLNKDLGSKEEFMNLFRSAEEQFNAFVSCHINIDDAYKHSSQWDDSIITLFPDGKLVHWEEYNNEMSYHISHTKDVESGSIFRRLTEFLNVLPIKKAIHIDAMRNTNVSWEPDGYVSEIEELECGLKPILGFFYDKGIDVSTEGLYFHPTEFAGLFSAIWHFSRRYWLQIYHGKLSGGGYRSFSNYKAGFGWSIHRDIKYKDFAEDWGGIVDKIYLGVLLSHFLNKHEMLGATFKPWLKSYEIRYSSNILAKCKFGRLKITWNDVLIANKSDRFIPLKGNIYIYSKKGGKKKFKLPDSWNNRKFEALTLSREGQKNLTNFVIIRHQIIIELLPRKPIILRLKN